MTEQEMQQEIERLGCELAAMTKSRDRLRTWLCQSLGFETDPDVLEQELKELEARPAELDDLLRGIFPNGKQTVANGDASELKRPNVPANA